MIARSPLHQDLSHSPGAPAKLLVGGGEILVFSRSIPSQNFGLWKRFSTSLDLGPAGFLVSKG
jgi:hypothetical protein